MPDPLIDGRYRVVRRLGEGGSASVLLCEDSLRGGQRVALKQLGPDVDRGVLEAELEALGALVHPGLAALLDVQAAGERPYFTSEYVEGATLQNWARGCEQPEILRTLLALLQPIALLHHRGWVHGDLKPANVLVTAAGQPRLVDFGLAHRGSGAAAGTAGYAAPEVLAGSPTTFRADVYSFAVVALEALTHRRAFGVTAEEVVQRQVDGRSILSEATELSPGLRSVLEGCLDREPERRPASGVELLPRFADATGLSAVAPVEALPEPALAGRDEELRAIEALLAGVDAGRPGAICIAGERGLGKTRLLREARQLALRRGFAVAQARGLRDALAVLAASAGGAAALETPLAATLAGLLPSLSTTAAPAVDLRTRARAALFALAAVASRTRPLALLVDDLDTLEPLEEEALTGFAAALSGEDADPPRIAILVTASRALEALPGPKLAPLSAEAGLELLRSMIVGAAPFASLAALGAGSPLLLCESLRSWVRAGSTSAVDGLEYPDRVMALARDRLAGIAGDQRRALRLLALASLDLPSLNRLCRVDPGPLLAAGLVVERRGSGRVQLALAGEHLRQALVGELAGEDRLAMHREIATVLEELGAPAAEAAREWEETGERQLAAEAYLRAAQAGFDFRGRLASRAAELASSSWSGWAVAHRAAARAQAGAGEASEALAHLEALRTAGLDDADDRARMAELLVLLGEPARALDLGAGGLIEAQAFFLLGRNDEARRCCDALAPGGGRQNLQGLLALRGSRLTEAARCFEEAAASFRLSGDLPGLAKARNNLAIVQQRRGELRAARDSFQQAIEEAQRAGDPLRVIQCRLNHGTVCHLEGRPSSALRDYQQAVREASRLGSSRLEAQARVNLATLLIELGDSDGAGVELSRCGDDDVFVPLNRADLALLRHEAAEAERQLQAAETHPALRDDPAAAVEALLVRARLHLARGELEESAASASRAVGRSAGAGLERLADEARLAAMVARRRLPGAPAEELRRGLEQVARGMEDRGERSRLWLVYHELSLAEALLGRELEAAFHLAKARESVQALCEDLPEPMRRALLARPDFREVYAATRQGPRGGARVEPAASLGGAAGLDAEDAESLLRISLELGRIRDPAELVSRVLDKAIEISGAQRGLLILLEDERLRIAAARNVDQETLKRGSEQFSTTLAREVIGSGRAVVTVDASSDERFRAFVSVSALRLRSVLCVPLRIWGSIAGVIYLDNRFREGAFASRQIAALESLGAQAGLALDTARLLAEERRRNRELEEAKQKVEELTAELRQTIEKQSADLVEAEQLVRAQERQLAGLAQFDEIVGRGQAMRRVLEQVRKTAAAEIPVYIFGESGTGKELIARAVHRASPRSSGPLVTVNCGGLPGSLLASELFGHVRGAFTGAVRNHPGLFRMADRGTIFLDEVTEMSPELQVQLLRAVQTGTFRPVGAEDEVHVDVRVISASNVDLDEAVRRGSFREDLSYRLNVLRLDLPPLRDRREDIPLLVRHFLGDRPVQRTALRLLQAYDWPGNVRELANELARAAALAEGEIHAEDLSPRLQTVAGQAALPRQGSLEEQLQSFERELLKEALAATEQNATEAARRLNLSRAGLYKKLSRHGLLPARRTRS